MIARTWLRGGSANTACVAASFAAEAIGTARRRVHRHDRDPGRLGVYDAAFTGACRRAGAYFSVIEAACGPPALAAWPAQTRSPPSHRPRATWHNATADPEQRPGRAAK